MDKRGKKLIKIAYLTSRANLTLQLLTFWVASIGMIVVFVFAMLVNMVSIFGSFQCQQHEWAIVGPSAPAAGTNSIHRSGLGLVFGK
jgi:hypothetical protein